MGWLATAVSAHDAAMIKSIPANGDILAQSPTEVIAWFEEELASGQSTLTVFDAQGNQVDNGDGGIDLNDPDHASMIVTLPPLPDGSYTVQWHAVLLDGDATDGAFAFAVGEGQTVASPVLPSAPEEDANNPPPGIFLSIGGFVLVLLLAGGLIYRHRQS